MSLLLLVMSLKSHVLGNNQRMVLWQHGIIPFSCKCHCIVHKCVCSPFLLYSSAPPSATVQIAIYILPKELTPEWDKQPLGDQMVMTTASLLESGNTWQCKILFYPLDTYTNSETGNVLGLSVGPTTLSILCRTTDVLVSSVYVGANFKMIEHVL